jgi:hypothetical protein
MQNVKVDFGNDPDTPILYKLERIGHVTSDDIEPLVILSKLPNYAVEKGITWFEMYKTGKVTAVDLFMSDWSRTLTPGLCQSLHITMPILIQTGLTWSLIAKTKQPPQWFITLFGATLKDFDRVPGQVPIDFTWTKGMIEDAFDKPRGYLK